MLTLMRSPFAFAHFAERLPRVRQSQKGLRAHQQPLRVGFAQPDPSGCTRARTRGRISRRPGTHTGFYGPASRSGPRGAARKHAVEEPVLAGSQRAPKARPLTSSPRRTWSDHECEILRLQRQQRPDPWLGCCDRRMNMHQTVCPTTPARIRWLRKQVNAMLRNPPRNHSSS